MIRQFVKGHEEWLSQNFNLREFHCHCKNQECKTTYVSEELIESIQALRDYVGKLEVLSAFRCKQHNAAVGGQPNSYHLLALALDIKPLQASRYEALRAAKRILGFSNGGIGEYSWGLHLDVRGKPARWRG